MVYNYILIRGAGDLASGVACTLHRAGFRVVMTETPQPTCVRRLVSFAAAVDDEEVCIEGSCGRQAESFAGAVTLNLAGKIAVLVDPDGETLRRFPPLVFIDGAMMKQNTSTRMSDAPLVIGLGPGFTAGEDVHAVIETHRGGQLGHPIFQGSALADTGIPGQVLGYTSQRLVRSPAAGIFQGVKKIGDPVQAGETVALVDGVPVCPAIGGVLRGLLKSGLPVHQGMKVGDVHPADDAAICRKVTDKAWAVGQGILETIRTMEAEGNLILPDNKRDVFREVARLKKSGTSGILFTLLESPAGSSLPVGARLLTEENGLAMGSLGAAALDHAVLLRSPSLLKRMGDEAEIVDITLPEGRGEAKIFIEPVLPAKKLIIFGGGHISQPLAEMAAILGYRVVVWDDRPEFASLARFPQAERIFCSPLEELAANGKLEQEIDRASRLVIVTRGHRQDRACLELVIDSPAAYIGMIGSIPKINATFHALLTSGVAPELMEKVSAPTGLDLGGQSPAEVALSILAEIVAREHGGTAQPMKLKKGGLLQWMK